MGRGRTLKLVFPWDPSLDFSSDFQILHGSELVGYMFIGIYLLLYCQHLKDLKLLEDNA